MSETQIFFISVLPSSEYILSIANFFYKAQIEMHTDVLLGANLKILLTLLYILGVDVIIKNHLFF